ncbi:MAG TPA: DUF3606 domain-containing protein [Telluria sp.]
MADNVNIRGQQDRIRINVHEEHEVRYWTEALGITRDQLVAAVQEVGPMADAVRTKLDQQAA